jgi:hypothetical protein
VPIQGPKLADPSPPLTFSEQLLRYADDYSKQAIALRAPTAMLPNSPPNPEADRLEALSKHMVSQAIASDAANDAARVKANLDKWLADHKAVADWHNENTKSVISMSQASIALQVTINAGAAVALLAFLGNAINKNAGIVAGLFSSGLAIFATGVAVAALVSISSYTTQFLYGRESERLVWWGGVLHAVTYILGFCSLGLFVAGSFQTYDGMRSMAKLGINGTPSPNLTLTCAAPPASSTTEVPAMTEPPVKKPPAMGNDNAPKPFKTPPPQASVPAPAAPPPPAKK